jgi:hypothetical protein
MKEEEEEDHTHGSPLQDVSLTGENSAQEQQESLHQDDLLGQDGKQSEQDIERLLLEGEPSQQDAEPLQLEGEQNQRNVSLVDLLQGPACQVLPCYVRSCGCLNGGVCVNGGEGEFYCQCKFKFCGRRCGKRVGVNVC